MIDPQHIHKYARWFYLRGHTKIPEILRRFNYFLTGCDLPGHVKVGRNVRFQHFGQGVAININTEIGDDVVIMPGVVLGQNVRRGGQVVPLRKIIVGNRVLLGAGAKVIASGSLTIGDDAVVGANAVVLGDVPAGMMALGIPARCSLPRAHDDDQK